MTPEVERIFHEVADLPPAGRERYYATESVPAETSQEVETLVAHDAAAEQFLARPIRAEAGPALAQMLPHSRGTRCGPYELLNLIGAGGMGAVYRARRDDGEVTQEVAVKLLNFGARDRTFRERFLQERQILASLSHPNIARLLDAGHAAQGQPYLVMEFVDGIPIDSYCEKLAVRARVTLFLSVCDAVSHAHRHLVVHRDLKPANILVDHDGRPKLLDFGIARILGLDASATLTEHRALTPDYASPEQVTGRAPATASDIYSLGALLYKLIAGRSPHQFDPGTADSVVDAICRKESPPASRFETAARGDLDAILKKALRKEPGDRYATVDQFADDLRLYLESRPIRARQGETFYQFRRFLRRRWLPAAAVVMAILCLAVGFAVAQRERALAEQRFRQVRHLAGKVLALDGVLQNLSGSTKARHEVVAMSKEYLEALAAEAHTDQELAIEIAAAYSKLARVQGVPVTANLGRYAEADETLRQGQQLIENVLSNGPRNWDALLISAEIAHDRMILADTGGRKEEALAQAQRHSAGGSLAEPTGPPAVGNEQSGHGSPQPGAGKSEPASFR